MTSRLFSLPILALAAACVGLLAPAAAQTIPENDGWVTDRAGYLSASEERELETLMESYRVGSTHEIALLTVPSLEGQTIERFALEVARAWKMGTKEKNNAALLVVSRDDREARIEVGRGLEGDLTDSISGRIIRDVLAPEMSAGRPYEALRGAIEAMHAAAGGDYGQIPARRRPERSRGSGLAGLLPVLFLLLLFGSRRRAGGVLPWLLLGSLMGGRGRGGFGGFHGGSGGGGFSGFGGGGGFSGGGASGRW